MKRVGYLILFVVLTLTVYTFTLAAIHDRVGVPTAQPEEAGTVDANYSVIGL